MVSVPFLANITILFCFIALPRDSMTFDLTATWRSEVELMRRAG
jgi:hypothetical protein